MHFVRSFLSQASRLTRSRKMNRGALISWRTYVSYQISTAKEFVPTHPRRGRSLFAVGRVLVARYTASPAGTEHCSFELNIPMLPVRRYPKGCPSAYPQLHEVQSVDPRKGMIVSPSIGLGRFGKVSATVEKYVLKVITMLVNPTSAREILCHCEISSGAATSTMMCRTSLHASVKTQAEASCPYVKWRWSWKCPTSVPRDALAGSSFR